MPKFKTLFSQYQEFLNFPGSPVVRTLHFYSKGLGSIPGWGTKILHDALCGKNKTTTKKESLLGQTYSYSIIKFLEA